MKVEKDRKVIFGKLKNIEGNIQKELAELQKLIQ